MILYDKPKRVTESMLNTARVPKHFWTAQPDKIADKRCLRNLLKLVKKLPSLLGENKGVLFLGGHLTGKTAAACILLRQAISLGATCLFVYTHELPRIWPEKKAKDKISLDTLLNADLLVLDDIGSEYEKSKQTRHVEWLLRMRFEANHMTIGTTALTFSDMREVYTTALISVLQRALPAFVVYENRQFTNAVLDGVGPE